MADRTGYEQDDIETLLLRLDKVGNFEKASFGFPEDKVLQTRLHLTGKGERDPFTGLVFGEEVHPDEFIKGKTRLYRQSWFDPIVRELSRRFFLSNEVEGRRKEASKLKQEITLTQAKLENLRREIGEAETKIRSLAEAETKLREHKAELSRDLQAMHEKKAILAGELPAEVRASKRRLEL